MPTETMKLKLTNNQLDVVAKYLGDISKLVFAATMLGFLVPTSNTLLSIQTFLLGLVATVLFFVASIYLTK